MRAVLVGTANPQHPDEVLVSRPSDALAAGQIANLTLSAFDKISSWPRRMFGTLTENSGTLSE